MNRVDFIHQNQGVQVLLNGVNYGIFDDEKDAIWYLILNDLIDTVIITREVK